jgi:histidine triad (HIT) family protein
MADDVFAKIIRREILSHIIYEDEQTFVFLDIHPVQPGHVLVIPKVDVEFVWDLNNSDYRALMATVKKVALRLRDVMGTPYVGELIQGTDVPHAHIHLIPFTTADEFHALADMSLEPDHSALADLAKKLAF